MKTSIMIDREDIRKVEEEEKFNFIKNNLINMGIPLDDCFPESNELSDFTVEFKRHLRAVLGVAKVLVVDDRDGGIKIYFENEIIAEWKKCRFELREDRSTKDPRKRIYAVIHIDCWSLYDQPEEEENEG